MTTEAETTEVMKHKFVGASSSETVRSRSRTGKHARQLVSDWTRAWDAEGSPGPLPMPLQTLVSDPPLAKAQKLAASGHEGAIALETSVGGGSRGADHGVDVRQS